MPGRKNPMCNTFPRIGDMINMRIVTGRRLKMTISMTKRNCFMHVSASCNYWRWGSAGVQENINAICILALNHINDKVFLSSLVVVVIVVVVVVVFVVVVFVLLYLFPLHPQ